MSGYSFQDRDSIANSAVTHKVPTQESNAPRHGNGYRGRRPSSRSRTPTSQRGHSRPQSRPRRELDTKSPLPWNVFDVILREYHGKTNLHDIKHLFHDMSEYDIKEWLGNDKGKRFNVFTDSSDNISTISVNCRGKLCLHYGQGGCSRDVCTYFHLCRNFIAGNCKYGVQCKFSHHFQEEHNQEMVKKYSLSKYTDRELKIIIAMSVPQVCGKYNKDSCKLSTSCSYLHICESVVMSGSCTDKNCTLDDTFDSEHNKRILKLFNLDRESNLNLLRKCILVKRTDQRKANKPAASYHPRDGSSQNNQQSNQRGRSRRGRGRGGYSRPSSRQRYPSSNEENIKDDPDQYSSQENERVCRSRVSLHQETQNLKLDETWAGPTTKQTSRTSLRPPRSSTPSQNDMPLKSYQQSHTDMNMRGYSPSYSDGQNMSNSATNTISSSYGDRFQRTYSQSHNDRPTPSIIKPLMQCDLSQVYREKLGRKNRVPILSGAESSSKSHLKGKYICIDNLHGRCSLGQYCVNEHCDKQYAWFVNVFDNWFQVDAQQEMELENEYRYPEKYSHEIILHLNALDTPLKLAVNFNSLTAIAYGDYSEVQIRRLSTPTCRWQWYYDNRDKLQLKLQPALSEDTEKGFKEFEKKPSNNTREFKTKTGDVYIINYKDMRLTVVPHDREPANYSLKRRPIKDVII